MSETRELYEIKHEIERITPILDRIARALEKLAPQGSERERIALRLWETLDVEVEASFRHADGWIAERDKQRAKQAEERRTE
jgi:Na+/phosphate symporter